MADSFPLEVQQALHALSRAMDEQTKQTTSSKKVKSIIDESKKKFIAIYATRKERHITTFK